MHYKPHMNENAIIRGNQWRIGVLSDSLFRLEWSETNTFEDLPTLAITNRGFTRTPHYEICDTPDWITVETKYLRLTYNKQPFSKEGLSIVVKGLSDTKTNTWHFGDKQTGNLKGTARTLDWANGAIQLSNGVTSRDGWAVIDDSQSCVFLDDTTIKPRTNPETDLYFFGYGHRYSEAVSDFCNLSGKQPLLPRYAFGNWWSRFHQYTDQEYVSLLERFASNRLPFTVATIDMDWHLVDGIDPKYGSGWTGYTWNKTLFPNPKEFLHRVHQLGYHTTLNIHPRDGIRPFEECYAQAAHSMGIDPNSDTTIEFDLTDPDFISTYFDVHKRLEDEGVDFWWIDWQQGGVTRQQGLDPLWALNHMHYLHAARDGRWPLILSRYAGPGSQRYPIGFSGDTIVTWESLQYQPYFTATASNIGYGWWSHDIGGHMFGYYDEELETRWYQLGTFSPINRLHSTTSPFNSKEPWNFSPATERRMSDALRLRHQLIPYLYTMNWRSAEENKPLVTPMYWDHPELDEAYEASNEFMFGSELLAAPAVTPTDSASHMSKTKVWLPQGDWFDFFNGRRYSSPTEQGRVMSVWRPLEAIPIFAKAGAIIPMQPLSEDSVNSVTNPEQLEIYVFPGANGSFTLVEDNGASNENPAPARTEMTYRWNTDTASFHIRAASGDTDCVPQTRSWSIRFRAISKCNATVCVNGTQICSQTQYDDETLTLIVQLAQVPVNQDIAITLDRTTFAENPLAIDAFAILRRANMPYLTKERANRAIQQLGPRALTTLDSLEHVSGPDMEDCSDSHMPSTVRQALEEVLLRS